MKKLSKSELIKLLLIQRRRSLNIIVYMKWKNHQASSSKPRTYTEEGENQEARPGPDYQHLARVSNKWLKNMKKTSFYHLQNSGIITNPVPAPRTKQNAVKKPVPTPRTKIEQTDKALKGYTKSL